MPSSYGIDLTINMPDGGRHARQLLNFYFQDMAEDIQEIASNLCAGDKAVYARKFGNLTIKRADVWSSPDHNLKIFVLLSVSGDNEGFIKQVVAEYMDEFSMYLRKASSRYFSGADFLPDPSYQPADWTAEVVFT